MHKNFRVSLPFLALFASGVAALVLEVVWTRWATLILGTTTLATTMVLGTFMAGLAVGNLVIGFFLPRIQRPFLAYGIAEGGTALAAVFVAFFAKSALPTTPVIAVLLVLLLPTTLMGLTIPLMISGLGCLGIEEKRAVSWGYGVNTVGGALGAFIGAFWWLPAFGLFRAQGLAMGLLLLAVGASVPLWKLLTNESSTTANQKLDRKKCMESTATIWPGVALVFFLAFWGGGSSLAMEIIWTRLLALILGPSVYALGLVLVAYLTGIAVGALVVPSFLVPRTRPNALTGTILLIAFSVGGTAACFGLLPYLFVFFVSVFTPSSFGLRLIEWVLCMSVLFPPAFFHGMLVPILISKCPATQRLNSSGEKTAGVLGVNSLGAICGAAITGLFLIPRFGFLWTLAGILGVHISLSIILMFTLERIEGKRIRGSVAVCGGLFFIVFLLNARQYWDQSVLASGVYKYAVGDALRGGKASIEVGDVKFFREGISSTVAVIDTKDDRVLSIDGKADASVYGDRSTQVLLAALPLSLSLHTDNTLVIGFASGVTAGVASLFPNSHVTAVEIEPVVYDAARYFEIVNHGPLDPPDHEMVIGDARHYLLTTNRTFDVITSEPSNPWMSGVAPLFTLEFFALAKTRLVAGGVMCQWLPIYGMSEDLVATVLKTFKAVFPHVLVFESVEGYDLLLIGSERSLLLHPSRMDQHWSKSELRQDLAAIGIYNGLDLAGRFLMGNEGIERYVRSWPLNTDDNGYLEFKAPLALHLRTAENNDSRLSNVSEGIQPYLHSASKSQVIRKELADRFLRRNEKRLGEMVLQ